MAPATPIPCARPSHQPRMRAAFRAHDGGPLATLLSALAVHAHSAGRELATPTAQVRCAALCDSGARSPHPMSAKAAARCAALRDGLTCLPHVMPAMAAHSPCPRSLCSPPRRPRARRMQSLRWLPARRALCPHAGRPLATPPHALAASSPR
jgi:hypothetical protein